MNLKDLEVELINEPFQANKSLLELNSSMNKLIKCY